MDLESKRVYKDDIQCSGTVISRTSILTAAHCVFFRGYEDFMVLAGGRVIIGDKVDLKPQVNEVVVWSYMKGYPRYPPSSFENWRFDLAVLTLEDPIDDRFVTVPVLPPLQGPNCWSPKVGDILNAAGYPMEYPRKKQQQQWMHSCNLISLYPRIIHSTCDTLRGQVRWCGSCSVTPTSDSFVSICGVHAAQQNCLFVLVPSFHLLLSHHVQE